MSLNVLTWNVGTDERYKEMLQRAGDTPPEEPEGLVGLRNNRAKFAFGFLIESNEPDIMFLQEIGSDLDRIKEWLGKDFTIINNDNDTAVVYRTARFTFLTSYKSDIKLNNRSFTVLTLKDKSTEKIYNVASAHISGFDLMNPMKGKPNAPEGDKELEDLLSKLNELDATGTIIGLDANTTREHYRQRLEILEKEGFRTNDKDKAPTNYHRTLKDRVKSDYIYTRGFTFQPFERLNVDLEKPITCPSDHIPVIEQLKFDSTSIEKSKEPPVDLDESFEGAQSVSATADKNDPEVRQRLKKIGFTLTPSPSPATGRGTIKPSSSPGTFSLFSNDPVSPQSPGAEPAEASPTPDGSGNYLDTLGAMLGQGPTPPPLFESERDKSPDGLTGPSSGAASSAAPAVAAAEEPPLPTFDTEDVEGLQAALDATVVAAVLREDLPDLLGKGDLESEESAEESAAAAKAKVVAAARAEEAAAARAAAEKKAAMIAAAKAGLATTLPVPTKPLPKAPSKAKPRAALAPAPDRKAPALPIAGEADAAKTVKASAAVAAAMLERTLPGSSKAAAVRRRAEASAAAAGAAKAAPVSRKEKPKTDISCMRKTAIVTAGLFLAIALPLVGSFYRVE
ncbi:MAG: hypothetical protein KR126chlam4_00907 [Candidatus Anoxychlamydiales bacterium]|nr:hypothetical protein [Candidatus Anoxychlamydiales bacterium]HEU64891.1 hypothetical protein [Chlamydiota bacterium]